MKNSCKQFVSLQKEGKSTLHRAGQYVQVRDHLSPWQQYHHMGDPACEKSHAESEGGETKMMNPTSNRAAQIKQL